MGLEALPDAVLLQVLSFSCAWEARRSSVGESKPALMSWCF